MAKSKIRLFPKFDPRLKAELNGQRRTIAIGLACVLVSSLLQTAILPLLRTAINLIQEAAPLSMSVAEKDRNLHDTLEPRAKQISAAISAPESEVLALMMDQGHQAETLNDGALVTALQDHFKISRSQAEAAAKIPTNRTTGNRDAVIRMGYFSFLIILVYIIKYWFTRGQAYYLSKAAARLATDLRIRLFRKLQNLPVSYFSEKRAGNIYSVLTNDVNVYQNAVSIVRDSIDGPVIAIGAFIYIVYSQWQLAVLALVFIPPMGWVIQRNSKKMKGAQFAVQEDLGELGAMTNEAIMGTRVIRAFAAEGKIEKTYNALVERTFESQRVSIKQFATLRPLVELIGAVALASVLYICGWLSYYGVVDLGMIAALIYGLDKINGGFRSIGSVANTYSMVEAASHRIHAEILDAHEMDESTSGQTIENPRGRIEFRNVSFSYPDGTEALRNVNFIIEPGTSLALVGPSGAGKSTIADLVLRFYDPSEGEVLFDDVNVRDLNLHWLRRQIGVVPQATFLFAGTVADNIRLGKEDATMAEIEEAARAAHAEEFITTMERKYDAELGESGIKVSGGQRQRIAIARALVRKPTLLLLDEATSALDSTSEKLVTEALEEIMQTRSTIFIAHRLTTAARADRILVLRRGEIVEEGSHHSLMEMSGVYAGLFKAFSGGVLD